MKLGDAVSKDFKQVCVDLTKLVRDRIAEKLQASLLVVAVTDDMLTHYPFLRNKSKFQEDYMSCIEVVDDPKGDGVLLRIRRERFRQLGLPNNTSELLEFGTTHLPPVPHLHPALTAVPEMMKAVLP